MSKHVFREVGLNGGLRYIRVFPTLPSNSQQTLNGCPRNLTQFWHYLSEDSIRPHRVRAQSHFRCQLQVQVVTCAPVWLNIGGSHNTILRFNYFARAADATQRNVWFCLPVYFKGYCKGIQMGSQTKGRTCVASSRMVRWNWVHHPPGMWMDVFPHLEAYQFLLMFKSFYRT